MADPRAVGVLILGGGEATRLPNKLALDAGNVPMIVRVYRNVSPGRTVFLSCKATFAPEIDALLPCPMVVDRWPLRGPLAGLLSTMQAMPTPYVFAVAGDAPFVDAPFVDRLAAHLEPGDEAVIPQHAGGIEPLAAIYERAAFLREGVPVLFGGKGALRVVIDRLKTRYVRVDDERVFANVNTPGDYEAVRGALR
ncbi:MAG: molybdenum cofactor guanylyltransferase [Candidatus Velthaea sp.]